nr:SdpI family protein [Natrinema gelatinilyticum]
MSKSLALTLVSALSAVVMTVFALIPRIHPRSENVAAFRPAYDWFVVVFAGFMAIVHAGIIAFNLGYEFDVVRLILGAVAGLFYAVGTLLPRAKSNWFVGIRTPWTLSSDTVWDRTHDLTGRLFKLTAVVAVVGLLFDEYAVYVLVVPALVTTATAVAFSYYCFRRLER